MCSSRWSLFSPFTEETGKQRTHVDFGTSAQKKPNLYVAQKPHDALLQRPTVLFVTSGNAIYPIVANSIQKGL